MGCLVALALIVLIAVVAGWLGQWGIFAPEKDQQTNRRAAVSGEQ
jgi:hypothetical protein